MCVRRLLALLLRDSTQTSSFCTKAISCLSGERLKLVTPWKPARGWGFEEEVETLQSCPSLLKMRSSEDDHSKWWMSEVRISGSTGKLVRATGCSPALTMK